MDAQNNKEQISLTEFIRDIGQKTDTRVVCTPDAHYCEKKMLWIKGFFYAIV